MDRDQFTCFAPDVRATLAAMTGDDDLDAALLQDRWGPDVGRCLFDRAWVMWHDGREKVA